MAKIVRSTTVEAPFSRVSGYVASFFEGRKTLRVSGPLTTSVPVDVRHEVVEDESDSAWRHDAVSFRWKPRWPVFPNLAAVLTVRPEAPGSALTLTGSYEPPGGAVGQLFEFALGRRLAIATMDDLLRRLRLHIREHYAAFQRSLPTIEELNERERQRTKDLG